MNKKLVIVESPTKAKTITKFLDKTYKILSSYGHVRDLPVNKLGVKIENDFEPTYVVLKDKKPLVDELKKAARKAEMVYFATDEDREGEAISWHLLNLLGKDKIKHQRIAFHEITKEAVLSALKNPRQIDLNLVDAQQARRILDRLVGYKLSPFLWKKVAKGLSAGRVQSVAVRLIVEREREIQTFKPEEYWSLEALLEKTNQNPDKITKNFIAKLYKIKNKKLTKFEIQSKEAMDKLLNDLKGAEYIVEKIERKQGYKVAPAPFTTSSLQQEAHNKLGFSAKQTMYLAQNLYEGVKIGQEQVGLITYMRTDAVNLANSFIKQVRSYIQEQLGKDYLPTAAIKYKTKAKNAQEAHEAIRPTDINKSPDELSDFLDAKQLKLYRLIWQRSLACQIKAAEFDKTVVEIKAKDYLFKANGSVIKFAGWLKIYPLHSQNDILPELNLQERLKLIKLNAKQSFTEPPARYNDASLVKKLEELEIGRPSTYAPIISTIQQRNYVRRENGRFYPQDISFIVIDLLKKHFPNIVEYAFTAKMEKDLDEIAAGRKKWKPVIKEFYEPFAENLDKKYSQIDKRALINETTDKKCPKCGRPLVIKTSRFGKFLACTGFPDCRYTEPLEGQKAKEKNNKEQDKKEIELTDVKCEKCGQPMVVKYGRFGKFLACSAFPKCKNTKALDQDTGVSCPQCGQGKIVAKRTKRGKTFYACDQYPKCKFALWAKPTGEKCPKCGSLLVNAGGNKTKCSNKDCKYVNVIKTASKKDKI